jgi:predicted DNA-binding transcriptional regulator
LASDRVIGGGILGGSALGIILYGVLMYYWPLALVELTAFVAVAALLGILAWIGYTMATTPPPEPIAEVPGPEPSAKGEAPPA